MDIDDLTVEEENAVWDSFQEYRELSASLAIEMKPSLEFFWLNELRNHPGYYMSGDSFLERNPSNYITTAPRGTGPMPVNVQRRRRR